MNNIKKGQIVKFHTPFKDEDPNQLYVVLETMEDGNKSRAKIMALNTDFALPPVCVVLTIDLEIDYCLTRGLEKFNQVDDVLNYLK